MLRRAVFHLVMLIAVAANAISQTDVIPQGHMSLEIFRETYWNLRNSDALKGAQSIDSSMVPNSVHDAVWRELNRFTLRNGYVFSVLSSDRTFHFIFQIQITNNGRSWTGWVWRRLRT